MYLLVIVGLIGFVRKMAQEIKENAVIDNTMIIANSFKEKACLPWFKSEFAIANGKGKAVFKKAAQNRLDDFEEFDGLDKAVKAAKDESEITAAKENLTKASKAFGEGGHLHEIQTRAFALAQAAAKADPLGQTPMSSLGIGLSLDSEKDFGLFKEALVQSVIWSARQVKNEAAQAAAKAEAEEKAKAEVETLFEAIYDGPEVEAWLTQGSEDEAFLKAGKTIILRAQSLIRAELKGIEEQGSGSTARANAILDLVEEICSDMEQGLSDKALHAKDRDGSRIWGQPTRLQIGTTARKILEACQVKLSALHSKADRTLSRLAAMQGSAKIVW